jgi:hypothetical protein
VAEGEKREGGWRERLKKAGGRVPPAITWLAVVLGGFATVVGTLVVIGILSPVGGTGTAVADAAAKTIDQGTSQAACTVTRLLADGSKDRLFTLEGTFDYRQPLARVTYDLSGLFAGSNGKFPTALPTFSDDNIIYYKRKRVDGKPWIAVNSAELYGQADIGSLFAYTTDPAGLLPALKSSGKVTSLGSDQLPDGRATHYRGTLDLPRVADSAAPEMRATLRDAIHGLERVGWSQTWPTDVWIADDGLVHQIAVQFRLRGQTLIRDCSLFHFGAPIDTTPPPADQVKLIAADRFFTEIAGRPAVGNGSPPVPLALGIAGAGKAGGSKAASSATPLVWTSILQVVFATPAVGLLGPPGHKPRAHHGSVPKAPKAP